MDPNEIQRNSERWDRPLPNLEHADMNNQIASRPTTMRHPVDSGHGFGEASGSLPSTGPSRWAKLRRPVQPTERVLHRDAAEWVLQLPESLRPASTCARYPRIVNLIVDVWLRGDQCRHLFEQLMSDRRPARRGFPLSVREELQALAAFRLEGVLPSAKESC